MLIFVVRLLVIQYFTFSSNPIKYFANITVTISTTSRIHYIVTMQLFLKLLKPPVPGSTQGTGFPEM